MRIVFEVLFFFYEVVGILPVITSVMCKVYPVRCDLLAGAKVAHVIVAAAEVRHLAGASCLWRVSVELSELRSKDTKNAASGKTVALWVGESASVALRYSEYFWLGFHAGPLGSSRNGFNAKI